MSKKEKPSAPFKSARDPRPKGAQKGVAKRDNGKASAYTNSRVKKGK